MSRLAVQARPTAQGPALNLALGLGLHCPVRVTGTDALSGVGAQETCGRCGSSPVVKLTPPCYAVCRLAGERIRLFKFCEADPPQRGVFSCGRRSPRHKRLPVRCSRWSTGWSASSASSLRGKCMHCNARVPAVVRRCLRSVLQPPHRNDCLEPPSSAARVPHVLHALGLRATKSRHHPDVQGLASCAVTSRVAGARRPGSHTAQPFVVVQGVRTGCGAFGRPAG